MVGGFRPQAYQKTRFHSFSVFLSPLQSLYISYHSKLGRRTRAESFEKQRSDKKNRIHFGAKFLSLFRLILGPMNPSPCVEDCIASF